ncbi:MAG: hypothetical protein ACREJC_09380 [Tepidisphaeraceae bacterium]
MYEELADVLDSHEEALAVLESARALYGSNMDLDTLATIRQSDHELVKRFAATNLDDRQASKVLQGLQAILIGEPIRNREQLRLLNIAFGGNEARMEALLTRIKANHQPLGRTAEAFEAPIGPIQEEEVTTEEAERAAGLRPEGETEGFQEEAPAARFELGLSKAFVPASDKALVASTVKRLREQYPDIGIEVRPLSALSEEEAGKDPTEFLIDFLERSTDKRATQQLAELSEVLDDPTGVDEVLGKYVYFRYGEGTRGEELSAQDYAAIKSAANTKGSAEQGTLTLLDAEGKQQIFSAVEMVKRFMRMSGVRSADALPVNIQRALAAGIGAIAERSDAKSFFAQPGKKIEIKAGIVPSPFRAERPELLLSNLKIGESDPMVERILTWAKKQVTPRLTEFDTKRGTSLPDASIAFGMGDRNFTLDVSSSAMQIREGDKVVAGPVLRPDLLVHRTADKKDMLWRDVQVKPEPASIAEYMSPSARAKAETRLNRAITSQLATAQKSGNKQLEATMRDLAGRANKLAIIDEISEMDFDAAQEHPLFQAYEAVLEDAGPSIANAASREQERTDAPKRTSPETQIIEEIIEEPGQRARRVERAVPIETRERVVRRAGATKAEELLGGTQIAIPGPTRQQPEFEAEEMNRATAAKREAQPRIFDEFETLVGTPLRGSKAPAGPAEFGATQVPEGVRGTREPTTLARAVMRARRLVESTPENKAILNRAERAGGHPELTGAMRQELIQAVNRHALADPKQISDVLDDLSARITRARGGARSAGKPARSDADTGSDRVPRGTQEEVINEIKRVLGDGVRVEWVENMGHAGEAITDEHLAELIRLAATAANPMGVAHHEAFHVFLVRLQKMPGGARIVDALIAAASTKAVQSRLRQALAGQPGALQQLEDPIERVVYAYQFFRADPSLRLTPEAKTWLQKLSLFLRKVVGMLTQAQIADRTFDAFAAGTFNDPVVMRDWFENRLESILPDAAVAFMNKHPIMSSINAILSSGDAFMRETGIPAYTKIAELAQAGLGSAKGFLPERNRRMAQWGNELEAIVRGKSDEEIDAAHRNMQLGREPSNDLERDVRRLLDRFFRYISESNVERPVFGRPGEWESIPFRKNYYPGVWDAEFIAGNRKAFDALLEKHGFGEPKAREKIAENILSGAAAEDVVQGDFDKGFTPYMQATSERQLNTLYDDADSLQFRSKNLVETLQRYLYQGVHRAEYVKSFGNRGEILRDLLSEGAKEGATPTQAKWAADYARAVEGTLGSTISPQLRQVQGWMLLYQNLRLLPLSMFSAMVDPLAIGMRAGSFQVAARAYVRGMRLAFRGMEESELANMARLIGAIDEKAALESLGQLTGSVYMTKTQRAISDRFFRVIGMTGWNNGMRLAATEAAIEFLRTHTQTPKTHSARWIDELGLKKGDVQFDADGKIKLSPSEGLTREQAERVRQGINKWVNSVVMRPTAAERPIWASSPYFALVFHLKQFTYSFQRNIMRYVFREAQHGNYWPIMAATSYVPTMLAADFMRGMIQGLGDEPDYKKKWTFGDRTWNAVERSGFTGIPQFAFDSVEDAKRGQTGLETVLGPTLGHTSKLLQTLSGDKDVGRFALQSLPGQVIFKHW